MIGYVHAMIAYTGIVLVIGGYLGYVWHGIKVTPKLIRGEQQRCAEWIRQRDEVIRALQEEKRESDIQATNSQ